IGTDSLASSRKEGSQPPELNLWDEMRLFAKRNPAVSPREILQLTTVRPAHALHKQDELGALQSGFRADCVALTYTGPASESRIYEELLYTGRVREVFIGGEKVRTP
ncbi:MAG: amidohydrolase family protein, partial [Limisphaerales bacterium]